MLYDKRWDAKPDVFSLESLIAWLEKMPANKEYQYRDCRGCMLCQYFTAMGFKGVRVASDAFDHSQGMVLLPPHFNDIAQNPNEPYAPGERTFGAALARARSQQHTARVL